ncbi:PKD domain-containing protein [Flavobacterium sp.]|uniref:PKD domain-containing protein n=1 Tax=Flavobacterium sp. TaxID=239 RepID=UPI00286B4AC0|nr:PKD domain-containing protein [Flavobacterium sp.]
MKLFGNFILALLLLGNSIRSYAATDNDKKFTTEKKVILLGATISGTTTVCQNSASPVITFTGSGGTSPYTFTYNINGGPALTISTIGSNSSVTVAVNTSVATNLTYNLINVIDTVSPIQIQNGSAIVTIKLSPDATLGGTGSGSIFNGIPVFRVCSNVVSPFTFTNTSSTTSLNTNYTINWGDGSPDFISTSWSSTPHTYAIGLWNLVYNIQGNNGCNTTKQYIVFVGSNPAVSLGNPGNTDICNSSSLTFPITGTTNNPPGTTYTVTFNDGSTPQVFNHPPPPSVTHSFTVSSCGVTSSDGSNSYPNSFSANIVASNPCNTSSVGVVPIYVSTPPIADFTIPATACINTQVCMTNSSVGAFENNGSSVACNTSPKIIWSISPTTGFSINSGSLGNDFGSADPGLWLTGSNTLCLSFTQLGTYTVTIKTGNRCGFDTETKTICVEAPLVPLFSLSNNSGCAPLGVTTNNTTNLTTSCTATSFLWAVTYAAGNCGTSSGWTYTGGTNQNSANPSFNFTTPGTYNIKLNATNSCGPVTSAIQTVVVKKPPTATINVIPNFCGTASITPTANINGCAPASSTLTYDWSFPGGSPISSPLSSPGTITYNTIGNYTVSLTVTNECGVSTTATELFSVNAVPIITNPILNQTICSGSQTTLITLTSNWLNTTYVWSASATPGISGYTPSGNTSTIPAQTITTTSTTAGTVTYTITASVGSCQGVPVNYTINVNPAPTNTTPLVSSSVCVGGIPNVLSISLSSASVTPTYQWYSNNNTSGSGGTPIPGETNATFNPPATTAGTFYYYCIVLLSSGGCSSITSNTATVVIHPLPSITTQPIATQNLCVGGAIATPLSITAIGGTGTISYQWYSNTTNSTIGATPVGTNATSYTPPIFTSVGTYYYYVVVSANGNGCGTTTSTFAEVVVSADPTISNQPLTTQTLCQGTTPTTLSVTASGGLGAYTYQWYNGSGSITGATTDTYTPITTSVGTTNYYCIVSQPGLGCAVTSANAAVIIVPAPTITGQPQSSAICLGGTPTPLSVTYTNGTGTASYQWYDGSGLISGATNATYTPTVTTTTSYYCIITFSSGGCTNITSNTAVVTVAQLPSIDTQPIATQNICVGGIIPALTVSYINGAGTPTYQWYSNNSNTTSGGTPVGTNSPSFTPSPFNSAGTFYYYAIVSLSGNGCGTAISNTSEVIVVTDPTLTTQPTTTQTLCQGSTPTNLSVNATGGLGAFSYQWYSNSPLNTLIPGETYDTFTPTTAIPGTTNYYCIVSQPGIGCQVTSNFAEVVVVPAPLITTQPQSRAVCEGGTVAPINVAYINGTGTATYQWYWNANNLNSGGTLILGATTDTYNPPANNVGTLYYYCEITFSSGGCTLITSNTAEVIIYQIPVITPQNVVVCSGDVLNFIPQPGSGNTVPANTLYTWNLISINPSGSVSGTTNETVPQTGLIQTLVNSTNQVATVTYSVTPIAGICTGNPFTVEVLVYPKPAVVFDIADQTICNGTTSNSVTLSSSTPGGITFDWTANVPAGINGAVTSGTNSIPLQTLVNTTALPLTVTYSAVGTFNYNGVGCNGPVSIYSITVNPTIVASGTISNYNGYGVSFFGATDGSIDITVTGGSGSYTYTWSGPNGFSVSTQDLNGIPAGTYTVTIDDGFCTPTILTFTLTQPPELLFNEDIAAHVNLICFGDSNGTLGITITQESVPPYDFELINSSGTIVNTILNNTNLNQIFNGLVADTYSVRITDANGGVKTLSGITITQPNDILITATTTPITCYGANNASITLTVSGGTGPYQAQWSNLATGFYQNNLSADTYIITVTDSNNCSKPITVIIPEALLFTVNPIVKNISCFGANDGSINLNFVGGIPAINLAWSDGSTAGTTRNHLGPGTYSVTIVDGTPCTIARTFTIVEPQSLVLSANLTQAFDCNNANSGEINLMVSGGTPPFAYSWSNGAVTEDLTAISAGNYLITVTDASGCNKTEQYVISRQDPINIAVTTQTDFDCETHYVNQNFIAQVTGGIPPYQLHWSSGTISGSNNEIMHSNNNGSVLLVVTDGYGCMANYNVDVDTPVLGYTSFDTSSYGYTTFGLYSIGDPIQFQSNVTGDYTSISWDFGDGTYSTELNPIHTYNIAKDYVIKQTVTYPFGCIYIQTISLIVEQGYVLVVPTAFTPNNDGLNDTFRPVTKSLKNVKLDVYDTWGSLIYSETGDVLKGWDAKIKGIDAENGNYYSKVSAETFYGTIVNSNQTFTLIK